jgi:hypothetical protein
VHDRGSFGAVAINLCVKTGLTLGSFRGTARSRRARPPHPRSARRGWPPIGERDRAHLRVNDVDHLKRVIDRIRQGRRGSAKVIGTKTLIVLETSTGPAGA